MHPEHPFLLAETAYAVHHEFAHTAEDVLTRRARLAFLHQRHAIEALPKVCSVLQQINHWTPERTQQEIERTQASIQEMGPIS